MRDRSHDESMAEVYRDDPGYALFLLNELLEDGEPGEFEVVLRQFRKAFGVEVPCDSENGKPSIESVMTVVKAMGLRLSCATVDTRALEELSSHGSLAIPEDETAGVLHR